MSDFKRGGGSVVVKRLACGAEDRSSSPGLATMISEIGYLPLTSRDMTEMTLKLHATIPGLDNPKRAKSGFYCRHNIPETI